MMTSTKGDGRTARSRATRRRITEAAYKLFCERGFGVPMTAIAEEAGVAVQTLYFSFHTKLDLLSAALQLAVLGDDRPVPPHEREWFAEMVAETDPRAALRILLEGTQGIYDRLGPLAGVFATNDPEVAAMWARSEELRLEGMRTMTAALLMKDASHAVDLDTATDVVFVLLSAATYQAFADRGWSPEQWRAWTAEAVARALWPTAAPGPRPPTGRGRRRSAPQPT